jgi:hypothetical protein
MVLGWAVASCSASPAALAARLFVPTPDVTWEALLPYLRSDVVVTVVGDELEVRVCTEAQDRSVITPYNIALGEFARILLFELLRTEGRAEQTVARLTEQFRIALPSSSAAQRQSLGAQFWLALSAEPAFAVPLKKLFARAKKDGQLRCWLCERGLLLEALTPRKRK